MYFYSLQFRWCTHLLLPTSVAGTPPPLLGTLKARPALPPTKAPTCEQRASAGAGAPEALSYLRRDINAMSHWSFDTPI